MKILLPVMAKGWVRGYRDIKKSILHTLKTRRTINNSRKCRDAGLFQIRKGTGSQEEIKRSKERCRKLDMHTVGIALQVKKSIALEVINKAIAQNERNRMVSTGLIRAYNTAYRKFHKEDPENVPLWSICTEGSKGEIWRTSDGWGYFYFWVSPKRRITHIAHKMPDVMAYHFYKPFDAFAKQQGITRNTFKDKLGFGDSKWGALMRKFVDDSVEKSINTYTPVPNIVWSILIQLGYSFSVRDNKATLQNGCTIKINNGKVKIDGKDANKIFQLLRTKMEQKQTSEDWVDGHMTVGHNDTGTKHWG